MLEKIAEYVLRDDFSPRQILFCAVASLEDLPAALTPLPGSFVLLVAVDATDIANRTILEVGKMLISQGMVYTCVWGPDCEKVHDNVDHVIVQENPSETTANVIFTTWHSKDTLEEAVSFFLNCAWPAPAYEQGCTSWVAAVIGNTEWQKAVKEAILHFDQN